MGVIKDLTDVRDEQINLMYKYFNLAREVDCPELTNRYETMAKQAESIIAIIDATIKIEVEICQLKK